MAGRNFARTLALSASGLTLIGGLAACAPSSHSQGAGSNLNSGIIGGQEATGSEDFAKTVVLLYDKDMGALCTASILSDKLLVTAAHCVSGAATSLYVVFGTDISQTPLVVRRVVTTATTTVWPTRQGEDLNTGDMALVGFIGGLPAGYKPAQMLADASQLKDGETITLAGYGTSDGVAASGAGKLRFVDTTIQTAKYTDSEILMEQSKGKGACHGDSGGPAYINVNGQRLLVGVTSRGVNDPDNHCGVSSAYTSIAAYQDWIKTEAVVISTNVDRITLALKNAANKAQAGKPPQNATRAPQNAARRNSNSRTPAA